MSKTDSSTVSQEYCRVTFILTELSYCVPCIERPMQTFFEVYSPLTLLHYCACFNRDLWLYIIERAHQQMQDLFSDLDWRRVYAKEMTLSCAGIVHLDLLSLLKAPRLQRLKLRGRTIKFRNVDEAIKEKHHVKGFNLYLLSSNELNLDVEQLCVLGFKVYPGLPIRFETFPRTGGKWLHAEL